MDILLGYSVGGHRCESKTVLYVKAYGLEYDQPYESNQLRLF